ncbi:DUF3187 family protein [Shewanella sp. DNRA4]|uniref:DUF3187 family protein n=1 Tax=Shewanella sp. DNRA4 TaxID=2723055 RepID=UPI00146CFE86|nr:DUF3187 family protein [Shewanella sp. DNRA4]NMD52820.1 DUF3187 family protein [Shewanella sp. DNRA4]
MPFSHLKSVLTLSLLFTQNVLATAVDFSDYGPLRSYAQSPAQAGSLTPMLRSGFSLPEGQKELHLSASAASVWAETDDYFADYYHNTLEGGLTWQVNDKWMIDTSYHWRFSGDNHLDSVTMWFHDAFGFSQNGREDAAKHQNQIFSKDAVNQQDISGENLNNVVILYVGYQLFENQYQGLSLGGSLYYNYVDSVPFEDESFEQALQLNYSFRYEKHHVHSTAAVSFRQGNEVLSGISYDNHAYSVNLGYEYLTSRHGWLLELHHYQGLLETENDFSKASNEILLGDRYYLDTSAIEFSIVENYFNMDNSTDIAFNIGYRVKF